MSYDVRAVILYDLNNNPLEVQDGAVIPAGTSGILNYGTDAGTARIILVDSSGRQIVVGAAADGAAFAGNPVLVGGQDGVNAQSLLMDTSGRPNVVGAAAEGAAVAGNPLRTGAADGAGLTVTLRAGVVGVTVTPTGYPNTLPMGRFLTVPPALADGDFQHLMLDGFGNLRVTGTFTTTPNVVGTHGNAWSAALTGVNGTSASIDCQFTPFVSVFGNVSGATVITMQYSQDNVNFYDAVTTTLPAAGDLEMSRTVGARYVRLKSSLNVTATITISAKD